MIECNKGIQFHIEKEVETKYRKICLIFPFSFHDINKVFQKKMIILRNF